MLVATSAGLTACAGLSPSAFERSTTLASRRHWSGRLVLTIEHPRPERLGALFDWVQEGDAGAIDLTGLLGVSLARIRWDAKDGARLVTASGEQRHANLDALTEGVLGVPLPLVAIQSWLIGLAAPADSWQTDLSEWPQGRIQAQHQGPRWTLSLRIQLDPNAPATPPLADAPPLGPQEAP